MTESGTALPCGNGICRSAGDLLYQEKYMGARRNILVICGSSQGQMYLGVMLGRIWYTPVLARTIGEGLVLAREKEISLVLFDGDMPDEERAAAVAAFRNEPSLRELPRVMLLTPGIHIVPESLLPEGWAAVVDKPISDISLLYDVLRRLNEDPRMTPRVPVRMHVDIEEQEPQRFLTSINISEGGIYLRTHTPLPEGTRLHLIFNLPNDAASIRVAGVVVRKSPLGAHLETEPGMGLRFVDPSEDTRNRIRNFVQWSLIGDLDWEPALETISNVVRPSLRAGSPESMNGAEYAELDI